MSMYVEFRGTLRPANGIGENLNLGVADLCVERASFGLVSSMWWDAQPNACGEQQIGLVAGNGGGEGAAEKARNELLVHI